MSMKIYEVAPGVRLQLSEEHKKSAYPDAKFIADTKMASPPPNPYPQTAGAPAPEEKPAVEPGTDEELRGFVANATISEVVARAGDDKELAVRLLEAEDESRDGDPRKGVTEGLAAVISE